MKNLPQIGCFYCEHRTPYDPDTDYCELLDRKFENRLCMTVCRLKDCPLREVESNAENDNIIRQSDNEKALLYLECDHFINYETVRNYLNAQKNRSKQI